MRARDEKAFPIRYFVTGSVTEPLIASQLPEDPALDQTLSVVSDALNET